MTTITPLVAEIHGRSQRFHAEIARRASMLTPREDRSYVIPNTPFGVPKIKPQPKPEILPYYVGPFESYYREMWFFDLATKVPRGDPLNTYIRIEKIQNIVAAEYNMTKIDILAMRRTAQYVRARQVAIYLAKTLTLRSLLDIGRRFRRDHTTILHSIRKIEKLKQKDPAFADHLEQLAARILA